MMLWWWACSSPVEPPPPPAGPPSVDAHARLFDREVLEVVPGVHVAIGYGLANSILIEGDDGVVIVDTMESATAAREVKAAFAERVDKPIHAVIVTHNHADHVFGSAVFAGEGVPVYAHATTESHIDRLVNVVRDVLQVRSLTMFGAALPEHARIEAGIGPRLRFSPEDIALKRPTHTVEDRLELEIAGLRIELVHAPGETDDQLFVWLPDRKILLPGDNVYQAFPNLYTIRGTPYRDVRVWVDSLDAMRDLGAEVLIPSHTRPVVGEPAVQEVLTAYRDAIQYVHDQTVRGMNAGLDPDTLADQVRLPPHLATHPWLQEHYGTVAWSVRSVYDGYLGWFDANPAKLEPLPPAERAQRYAAAFAAGQPLAVQAQAAFDRGDLAWAAELGELWRASEPASEDAKALLAEVYSARAADHINMNARHWYSTTAATLRGETEVTPYDPAASPADLIDGIPVDTFMRAMPARLRAEAVLDVDEQVAFDFTDVGQTWVLHVRRGVAEMRQRPGADVANRIETDTSTWKHLAARRIGIAGALLRGEVTLHGDALDVARVLRWFSPES